MKISEFPESNRIPDKGEYMFPIYVDRDEITWKISYKNLIKGIMEVLKTNDIEIIEKDNKIIFKKI
jgi:hypothetical protein